MNLENKLLAKSSSVPGSSNRKTIASDCKNIVVRVSKQHLQRRLLFEIACLPSRFQNRLFPILSIPSVILEVSPDTMDIVMEGPLKPESGAFTSPLSAHKLPLEASNHPLKPGVYVTAAESFAGLSLADAMPRYKIRLEKERDAALARNEPRQPPRRPVEDSQPSLDSILVPHKSKLEKDKEAAIAENKPRKPPSRTFEEQPSLDSVLTPHKSRLQREKEAAQAANEPRRPAVHIIENEQPSLDSMLKKSYSRVEREKQASAAAQAAAAAVADPSTATVIRPPRSRLQMEREASVRLAEKI
ncbi:hypothetical protein Ndes2526B_g09140 [Nannochloris sp. 'desiccata']